MHKNNQDYIETKGRWKRKTLALLILFSLGSIFSTQSQSMTNHDLEKIIYVVSDSIRGEEGNWQFMIKGRMLICITDTINNRLRIMSPIIEQKKLAHIDLIKLMEANSYTALDARYAIADNVLWSLFVHPLRELQKDEILSAINQVYTAALTYGTTYNSSGLTLPNKKELAKEKLEKGKM